MASSQSHLTSVETISSQGARTVNGVQQQDLEAANVLVFVGDGAGDPARVYAQPRENNSDNVAAAFKVFADAHRLDDGTTATEYRDGTWYIDKSLGTNGAGAACMGIKGQNDFGFWNPEFWIGFADFVSENSVGARFWYYDPNGNFYDAQPWQEGLSITSGDYVHVSNRFYQASTTGTTGATTPVHTSGTTSDGGVDWDWIETMSATNFRGVMGLCGKSDLPPTDLADLRFWTDGDIGMYRSQGIHFYEVPSAGQQASSPAASISYDTDARIRLEKGSSRLVIDSALMQWVNLRPNIARETLGDVDLPDISSGAAHFMINRTAASACTGFTGGSTGDMIHVHNVNSLVYHNAEAGVDATEWIRIPGGADYTAPARSITTFINETSYGWVPTGTGF